MLACTAFYTIIQEVNTVDDLNCWTLPMLRVSIQGREGGGVWKVPDLFLRTTFQI